ncbi:Cytosine deaminase FCY1 and related enzymes [Phaffia rhodozyma]|uniref:Cytosine deaminase FCY1 and related enzymes n=1 Tax=Phaffia rhodozyma TaxID=264483 RepID=A0A0F7SFZ7_PHARH|nr:Cytosine deaminase FCY1 and related enzymes [Phaffia rhodozyma]
MSVRLVISPPKLSDVDITQASGHVESLTSISTAERRKRPSRGKVRKEGRRPKDVELEVEVKQDMKRLKGHAGGTGCVVWRTSLYFLEYLLPQLYFSSMPSLYPPLFNVEALQQANVLELGSGTGLVATFLAKFVRRWVCSDQLDCLKLISQNVSSLDPSNKTNIEIAEVDWLHSTPPPTEAYDLILCLDCVYNPNVIKGLVQTFDSQAEEGRTVICIVMEVRAEDVVGEFLETWLQNGKSDGNKVHWIVNRFDWGDGDGAGGKFVGWLGWKGKH